MLSSSAKVYCWPERVFVQESRAVPKSPNQRTIPNRNSLCTMTPGKGGRVKEPMDRVRQVVVQMDSSTLRESLTDPRSLD